MNSIELFCFVLDDEDITLTQIEYEAKLQKFYNISLFNNVVDFFNNFNKSIAIVVIDYYVDKTINGLEILKTIHDINKDCKVILFSSQKDYKVVVSAFNDYNLFKYIDKNEESWVKKLFRYINLAKQDIEKEYDTENKRCNLTEKANYYLKRYEGI